MFGCGEFQFGFGTRRHFRADGMLEMKRKGAITISQDEKSCVVFGMPKEAIARGGVDFIEPLEKIPTRLIEIVQGYRKTV